MGKLRDCVRLSVPLTANGNGVGPHSKTGLDRWHGREIREAPTKGNSSAPSFRLTPHRHSCRWWHHCSKAGAEHSVSRYAGLASLRWAMCGVGTVKLES